MTSSTFFYEQLNKSLADDDKSSEEDLCLISHEQLTANFVKLDCGHKFNYNFIYKDVLNHRTKYNQMESFKSMVPIHQIRCPYCRTLHNGLLPYVEELKLNKINGVNFLQPEHHPVCREMCKGLKIINPNFDETMDESVTNPKHSYVKCVKYGTLIKVKNFGDTNPYCYEHKKLVLQELRQTDKETKIKCKEQAKALKLKCKEDLKSQKVASNPLIITNEIISTLDGSGNIMGCSKILKYGVNKGKPCNNKICQDGFCKRHVSKI
jgi:hypothetical protein